MTVTRGILYEIATCGLLYESSTGRLLYDNSGAYRIDRDDYYTRNQPAKSEELKNRVSVKYAPLVQGAPEEVYRSSEPISLAAGASVTLDAEYNNIPCINAAADKDNVTASSFSVSASYYSWGAIVTVTNTGAVAGTCELFIEATPLTVAEGKNYQSAENAPSIQENGVLEYKFPENHLIQSAEVADDIADALITAYSTPRKDVAVTWRGDPALELGDEITVPVYHRPPAAAIMGDFYVFKNKLDFDGTVKMQTEGRKL
jgi:hypothetical protein